MHARTYTGTDQATVEEAVLTLLAEECVCSPEHVYDHAEVMVIRPEKSKILRRQIVQVVQELALATSSASEQRWVVILQADMMNQEAANALLKLLEEPPDRTSFILTAYSAARLLPTIRSRTAVMAIAPKALESTHSELADTQSVAGRLALISKYHEAKTLDTEYRVLLDALRANQRMSDLAWLSRYSAYTQNVPNYRLLLEAWAVQGGHS